MEKEITIQDIIDSAKKLKELLEESKREFDTIEGFLREIFTDKIKAEEDFRKEDEHWTERENANGEVFKEGEPDIDTIAEQIEEQKELSGLN
jgi:hypothetical protein